MLLVLAVFFFANAQVVQAALSDEEQVTANQQATVNPPKLSDEERVTFDQEITIKERTQAAEAAENAAMVETDVAVEKAQASDNSQAVAYRNGKTGTEGETQKQITKAAAGVIGCLGANILAELLASTISSILAQNVSNVIDALTLVPVAEKGETAANIRADTNSKTGTFLNFTIAGFGAAAMVFPSWDAIAYCITNEIITYVANSTIAWVKGGFEGNPAFIDNPGQFFQDLANVEASSFLQGLAYGAEGTSICQPFRAHIVLDIARSHLASQAGMGGKSGYSQGGFGGGGEGVGGYGGCTLDDEQGNFKDFLAGNFSKGGWDTWFKLTQVDANNPYATYFNLKSQLDGSIQKQQDLADKELNWGKGFLSFKKCEDEVCKITTPGTVIEGQLEKTLGLAKDRLILAEKFDQVVAVVVDQLIQTALNKVFEEME